MNNVFFLNMNISEIKLTKARVRKRKKLELKAHKGYIFQLRVFCRICKHDLNHVSKVLKRYHLTKSLFVDYVISYME